MMLFIERVIRRIKIALYGWPFLADKPRSVIEGLAQDEVLIDVGANVGMYASFAKCRTYCFEPAEKPYMSLKANLEGNPRYSFYNMALSDHDGHETLYIHPWSGHNSIERPAHAVDTEDIACITLDSFVREYGIRPTFVKIDVEGHEEKVLAGAKETIERYHPRFLIETTDPDLLSGYTSTQIDRNNYLFTYNPTVRA